MSQKDVFLVRGIRTPFGTYGGRLSGIRPDDLLAEVIRDILMRTGIPYEAVDEVVTGCVGQAGEDNRNVARMAVLLSGLPVEIPGITVNRLCSSGLSSIVYGARSIMSNDAEIIIASGVESMSRAPYVMSKPTKAFERPAPKIFDSAIGWRFVNPLFKDTYPPIEMGETAERVAEKFGISRQRQDEFSFGSHLKAISAYKAGYYDDQIISLDNRKLGFKKLASEVIRDEVFREDINLEDLGNLPAVFIENGTVTAGNSSPLSDGAGALILASGRACEKYDLTPLARYVTSAQVGLEPSIMGMGPVPATKRALVKAGWKVDDLTHVEINEAFASQVLAVQDSLHIPTEILNSDGGAIALGHPLGASGIRLAITAMARMKRSGSPSKVLLSACIGVGQGESILLESC